MSPNDLHELFCGSFTDVLRESIFHEVTYRIPMTVTEIMEFPTTSFPICPRCQITMEYEYAAFCDRCGQRLDWSMYDDAKIVYPGSHKNTHD